jgi:hypothetical protein
LTTNGKDVSAYTGSPSLAVFVEIACFRVSGTLVPAGIASIGFPDSTAGAAGSGAKVVCAAAIPASSNTQIEAARIFIEGLPLPDHLVARLQFQMRPPEFQLAEHDLFFDQAD